MTAIPDPCLPNPCLNGGICTNVGGSCSSFTCECQKGNIGILCETGTNLLSFRHLRHMFDFSEGTTDIEVTSDWTGNHISNSLKKYSEELFYPPTHSQPQTSINVDHIISQ